MLRSMTTFAREEASGEGWSLVLELKSVNGRYCDVFIRLPKWMNPLEDRVRKLVQDRLVRGRIELSVQCEGKASGRVFFEPDIEVAKSYIEAVNRLGQEVGVCPDLDMASLLSLVRDVINVREEKEDIEHIWEKIEDPLESLLDKAIEMSEKEGAALEADLLKRISLIGERIDQIEARSKERFHEARSNLFERVQSALGEIPLDEARLAHEIVIMTDKLDITEEIVRAKSHIEQFKRMVVSGGTVGRKLDFMLQECFREVNTMASKASDAFISHMVVEVKGELEKMREQVQNVV